MREIEIFIEKCNKDAIIPEYANLGDAGADVFSIEDVTINPGETKLIHLGFKIAIPMGFEIQIRPRSGISLKTPLRLPNSPGTIDSGYRQELCIIIENSSETNFSNRGPFFVNEQNNQKGIYIIKKGDKIAQLVLKEVPVIKFLETSNIDNLGKNRNGGFGSSGTKKE